MLIINGEPDTLRGVSPVPREGVGNLLHLQQGAFALPFDLLASREIANIFENSDFIYMLNQAQGDRQILAKQLNISPHQLSYVTNTNAGEGIIFYGNVIIPFVDHFPKDTELYSIMTTKLEDLAQHDRKG